MLGAAPTEMHQLHVALMNTERCWVYKVRFFVSITREKHDIRKICYDNCLNKKGKI